MENIRISCIMEYIQEKQTTVKHHERPERMNFTSVIVVNAYSILLLIIIYRHSLKHSENSSLLNKLYRIIVQLTILMLFIDIFSRFDGNSDTLAPVLNHIGNFMIFLFSPIIPSVWLLFVNYYIFSEDKNKRLIHFLLALNAVHAVLLVLSQFFGWFYHIDSQNIYHRGPLYLLSASISIALLLVSYIFVVVNSKNISKKQYYSLLLFPLPPFICIVLQIVFYGVSLILNSLVISLLLVYLNVQSHSMYTDYLTEVYNRKKLELCLKEKINASTKGKGFSAIMLDLNDFKSINDTFGHYMGDDALQTTAKLLRSCLRSNDFIARFGGDEFIVVLDSSDTKYLEGIVDRIHSCFQRYNATDNRPYHLGVSMGYAVYDNVSSMNAEDFLRRIDRLMYENKRTNKI